MFRWALCRRLPTRLASYRSTHDQSVPTIVGLQGDAPNQVAGEVGWPGINRVEAGNAGGHPASLTREVTAEPKGKDLHGPVTAGAN